LFVTGLGLTVREAWNHGTERPGLLLLLAGMMGLPKTFPKSRGAAKDVERDQEMQS